MLTKQMVLNDLRKFQTFSIIMICLSVILIGTSISSSVLLIIHSTNLIQNNFTQFSPINVAYYTLSIVAIVIGIMIFVWAIIFMIYGLKIRRYFPRDDVFWVIMSILVYFFTFIIAIISLVKINQYIKEIASDKYGPENAPFIPKGPFPISGVSGW